MLKILHLVLTIVLKMLFFQHYEIYQIRSVEWWFSRVLDQFMCAYLSAFAGIPRRRGASWRGSRST